VSEDVFPPGGAGGFSAGSLLAGYRLEERIGRGGMAEVFRAWDERLGRPVALKVLVPELAEDPVFRERFIKESRAAAAVREPHIIPVFEAGEANGVLFITMPMVDGGDARSLVRETGPLLPGRAAEIVSQVASALDAAHEQGLVHRDVKPANMLLDIRPGRPDHVYLSDFGLTKAALDSSGLTASGHFLGTMDYAAPEQISGRPVDGRADQYALGCSAFELLCGEPPFRRDDLAAAVQAHLAGPPPSATSRLPWLPFEVDRVFARVLAKSPADRYDTCQEFADALRQVLGLRPPHGVGAGPVPPVPATDVVSPDRRSITGELTVSRSCNIPAASACRMLRSARHRQPSRARPWQHGQPPELRCPRRPGTQWAEMKNRPRIHCGVSSKSSYSGLSRRSSRRL
jgi:serine/threonine protein kinase